MFCNRQEAQDNSVLSSSGGEGAERQVRQSPFRRRRSTCGVLPCRENDVRKVRGEKLRRGLREALGKVRDLDSFPLVCEILSRRSVSG